MGRKRQATYGRPLEAVLNQIMEVIRKQATVNGNDQHGRFAGSVEEVVGETLNLRLRDNGRYSSATTYTAPLYWLKAIIPISRQGPHGPAAYLVRMRGKITRDDVLRWHIYNSQKQKEIRERKARQERAAGDTPDTTTGGPVTQYHFHASDNPLNHEHGGRAGWHHHDSAIQESGIHWLERPIDTSTQDTGQHTQVQDHRHGTKIGQHTHQGYEIHWVAFRRPRTRPEPAPTEPLKAEVRDDLAGGKPAVLVGPNPDGRYAKLVAIIQDLEAKLRQADRRHERDQDTIKELQDRLTAATDPSAAAADEIIGRYEGGPS
jgi:hypothetical protein